VGLAKEDRFLQVEGDAAAAILRAAQETPCDRIVISMLGWIRLKRLLKSAGRALVVLTSAEHPSKQLPILP
jgi:hypothetical protein